MKFKEALVMGIACGMTTVDEAIKLGDEKIVSPGRYNLTILKRDKSLANKNAVLYFCDLAN